MLAFSKNKKQKLSLEYITELDPGEDLSVFIDNLGNIYTISDSLNAWEKSSNITKWVNNKHVDKCNESSKRRFRKASRLYSIYSRVTDFESGMLHPSDLINDYDDKIKMSKSIILDVKTLNNEGNYVTVGGAWIEKDDKMHIFIDKNYQGRGFGSLLEELASNYQKFIGREKITCSLNIAREGTSWFKKRGWKIIKSNNYSMNVTAKKILK